MTHSNSTEEYIFVAGSAHLDIMATIENFHETVDKIGNLKMAFGGTAHNIAIDLAALGAPVTFMTALAEGPISQLITDALQRAGVRLHVRHLVTEYEAAFCAFLHEGEMQSAVTATLVDRIGFEPDYIERGIRRAKCVVADSNMTPITLDTIFKLSNKMGIPSFLAGVSEGKTTRITELSHKPTYFVLNEREAKYLQKHEGVKSISKLAAKLDVTFIVTLAERGAEVYPATGEPPILHEQPNPVTNPITTIGSGDMFLATLAKVHGLQGESLDDAIQLGFSQVVELLKKSHAHLGPHDSLQSGIQYAFDAAEMDELTQVFNRRGLNRYWANIMTSRQLASALIIDVDFFKKINDTHGHDAGDEALKVIGSHLKAEMRSGDVVGRWGGEEFVCLLKTGDEVEALATAERLRQGIERLKLTTVPEGLTVSIGTATQEPSKGLEDIIKKADIGLYYAKKNGRNRVHGA